MIITGKKFSKPEMSRVKNGDIILKSDNKPEERRRLDHILVEQHPEFNRSTLQNFTKSGYVTVDSKVVTKPNTEIIIKKDESDNPILPEIILSVPERQEPEDVKNLLIYEDENVIVINKPAGLLSMAKGEFTEEVTLEDYGLLVHRLDRDTSGVVILGKNPAVQSDLRRQFQERKTHKTYYAIVNGRPKMDEAMIDLPIARDLKIPTMFRVDPQGKSSQTYYKVIKSVDKLDQHNKPVTYSLIELKPITGRTHQLRVHLNYLGCPIVGDRVYNHDQKSGKITAPRLFLHAHALEITIPGKETGDRRTFTAPIPAEFEELMAE